MKIKPNSILIWNKTDFGDYEIYVEVVDFDKRSNNVYKLITNKKV